MVSRKNFSTIVNESCIPCHCKYNLYQKGSLERQWANTTRNGTEFLSFFGPKICDTLPDHIKSSETVDIVKTSQKVDSPRLPLQNLKSLFTTCWLYMNDCKAIYIYFLDDKGSMGDHVTIFVLELL